MMEAEFPTAWVRGLTDPLQLAAIARLAAMCLIVAAVLLLFVQKFLG